MWLGIISSAALLLFSVSAFADSCVFSAAAPFQLTSDTVDWTMQIASGRSCTRGLKLGPVNISEVKLLASPQSGQVVIKGPSFSYTAKPDFQGQDDFTLQVSARWSGSLGYRISRSLSLLWTNSSSTVLPPQRYAWCRESTFSRITATTILASRRSDVSGATLPWRSLAKSRISRRADQEEISHRYTL
jgi:hypothetical protein